jgi:hypothetical protein
MPKLVQQWDFFMNMPTKLQIKYVTKLSPDTLHNPLPSTMGYLMTPGPKAMYYWNVPLVTELAILSLLKTNCQLRTILRQYQKCIKLNAKFKILFHRQIYQVSAPIVK